jgi:hypothetical protein
MGFRRSPEQIKAERNLGPARLNTARVWPLASNSGGGLAPGLLW